MRWVTPVATVLADISAVVLTSAWNLYAPRIAKLYPIPRRFGAKGVVRYGFHHTDKELMIVRAVRGALGLGGSTKGTET